MISSIILAAAAITVGGMVWGFAQSATTRVADSYVEGVMTLKEECVERFTIEHVGYSASNNTLRVWIYNYGPNNIIVDIYVEVAEVGSAPPAEGITVPSKAIVRAQISITDASGKEVSIKAVSRRGNNVYSKYICP